MMKSVTLTFLGLLVSSVALAKPPTTTDSHLHLLDFLQNGDYLEDGELVRKGPGQALPAGERYKLIDAALWAMDGAHVSHALISGMPFVKKWNENESFRAGYYLDSSSRVVRARDTDYHIALALSDYRDHYGEESGGLDRLFPCVSGFDGTDMGGVDMIVKRMIEFPGTFRCIGEVMSRHDDLTNLTSGERPRVNHPALFRVFDFAGEFGIPVSLHHNITAISRGDDVKQPLYLDELLQTFKAFPGTQFIWCHAGISRRLNVEGMPAILDGVLSEHKDHVRIDLSWVVYGDYVKADWDSWLSLIEKYPDNFLVGSDQVGSYATYSETVRDYDELLKKLSRSTRDKVGRTNLLDMFSGEAPLIPRDYRYPEDRYTRGRTLQP